MLLVPILHRKVTIPIQQELEFRMRTLDGASFIAKAPLSYRIVHLRNEVRNLLRLHKEQQFELLLGHKLLDRVSATLEEYNIQPGAELTIVKIYSPSRCNYCSRHDLVPDGTVQRSSGRCRTCGDAFVA